MARLYRDMNLSFLSRLLLSGALEIRSRTRAARLCLMFSCSQISSFVQTVTTWEYKAQLSSLTNIAYPP